MLGALALEFLRVRGKASGDLVLALFFYGGIAAGAVIASRATAEGQSVNVLPYLFGSILTVTPNDVWLVVGLGILIVTSVAIAGRALFAIVVDEESARVSGLPVNFLNGLLVVLAAITIVAATQVVGTLLVAALMVLPVASGRLLARSFRTTVLVAVGVGIFSVVVGLAAARALGPRARRRDRARRRRGLRHHRRRHRPAPRQHRQHPHRPRPLDPDLVSGEQSRRQSDASLRRNEELRRSSGRGRRGRGGGARS